MTTSRSGGPAAPGTRPLTPWLLAGFGAVFAALVLALVAGPANLRNVFGASDAVAHTHAVQAALRELLATSIDAETGQRGFIIMGDEAYLEPYTRAQRTIASDVARVRTLTADNPAQQDDLARVVAAVNRRLALVDDSIRLRRDSGFAAAQIVVATGEGKRLMDDMRATVARMEAREDALLSTRNAQAARNYRAARAIGFGTTGLALLVLGLLFAGTRRFGVERRKAEQTADRLNVTLRSIGDAVLTTDSHGRILGMNPVAQSLMGWTEAEAAGKPAEELLVIVNEHTRRPAESPIGRVLREGVVVALANHAILISKDGREIPIDDSAAPIRGSDGEMLGVVMVFRDITERHHAERDRVTLVEAERSARAEAEAAEQRLRVALESGHMGTWQFGVRTGELKWSPGLEAIHGYAPGTFPGTFEAFKKEIYPDDSDRVMAAIGDAIEQRRDHDIEYRIVRNDGAVRWVEGRGQLFLDADGSPERLVGVCSDVTERKAAEEVLRLAKREAEEANRTKDEFLAMVSHELRTPLNAVVGWADMLRSGTLSGDRRDRAIEAIYSNAMRQTKLIDELLDLGRIMSGKLQMERSALDLPALLQNAVDVIQPAAEKKHIRLTVDAGEVPGPFYGDQARLQQVLWNLLSNAIKFTPDGGVVGISLRQAHGRMALTVTDSGQGIPREFLPFVFEPFRQVDQATTRRHGGLGLGLAIVRHLVEAHGGSVRAESAGQDKGATFIVQLPMVPAGSASARPDAQPPDLSPAPADGTRLNGIVVLTVDDDKDSRDLVVATLEPHGAVVLTASSSSEALEILRKTRVQVLLSDVAMPGEDGYTLLRRLRTAESPEIARVAAGALTSLAREEDRREAIRAGFQLHLTKPIDAVSLVEAVAALATRTPRTS